MAMLACGFLLGSGFGFVLGHWAVGPDRDLVQTGEIRPLAMGAELDIRYDRPYASLPCLAVEEPILSYEVVGQTPQGFRIRIKNFYANSDSARYIAKGPPAER
jgi:hypothetical protein